MAETRFDTEKLLFWLLPIAGLAGFLWLFQDILLPFILGLAATYLLNPAVNKLEARNFSRFWGTLIVLLSFLLVILTITAIIVPVLYREIDSLAREMPGLLDRAGQFLQPYIDRLRENVPGREEIDIGAILSQGSGPAANIFKNVSSSLIAGGAALTHMLSVLIIAPIVAFFALKEWPSIMTWMEDLLPPEHKNTVMDLLKQIDAKLSGFVRGQLLVAFILGVAYSVALSLAGLNYGFLIGVTAGILNIIPLLGSTVGLIVAVAVSWFQSFDWQYSLLIAAIFLAGQLIEGNFLTPKLLGDKVGMHPLWIFFALMAGGALGGVLGMLIAVPIAASIGVILYFLIGRYKESRFYKGSDSEKKPRSKPPPKPRKKGDA